MIHYNKISFVGNLVFDPDFREFNSGKKLYTLRVAIKIGKDLPGAIFIDMKAWDEGIHDTCKKLHKGDVVSVCGKLGAERWQTKDGKQASRHVIILKKIKPGIVDLDSEAEKEEVSEIKK